MTEENTIENAAETPASVEAPAVIKLQLRRNVINVPGGLLVVYNYADGKIAGQMEFKMFGHQGKQMLPIILEDMLNVTRNSAAFKALPETEAEVKDA